MNNKLALIAVFCVFLLPVVVATLIHSEWVDWRPAGTRNYGELLQPVVPLEDFEVSGRHNGTVDRDALKDQWILVYFQASPCGESCLENLYWLRQVRRAQDRHQLEVGLLFAGEHPLSVETASGIFELSEDFLVLDGPDSQAFWSQLPTEDRDGAFFILDPVGNIIMRYPQDTDHNGIRRDLRRLLTWTQRD